MLSPEKRACWQALQRQAITLTPQEKVQGGDMPGDTVRITAPVCRRVEKLLPHLAAKLEEKYGEYIPAKLVIAISGGSGSGKTSGAVALREALAQVGLTGYVLSGDNYPRRIPEHNDEERLAIFRSVGLKALLAAGAYTPERFVALQPEPTATRSSAKHTPGCTSINRAAAPHWQGISARWPSRITTH